MLKKNDEKRKHFVMIPDLVKLKCRNSYDEIVWSVVFRHAGEEGECYLTTKQTAAFCRISVAAVHDSRKHLLAVGLLKGEKKKRNGKGNPIWHLRVPDDLWKENNRVIESTTYKQRAQAFARCPVGEMPYDYLNDSHSEPSAQLESTDSPHESSYKLSTDSPHESVDSPHESVSEYASLYKKDLEREEGEAASRAKARQTFGNVEQITNSPETLVTNVSGEKADTLRHIAQVFANAGQSANGTSRHLPASLKEMEATGWEPPPDPPAAVSDSNAPRCDPFPTSPASDTPQGEGGPRTSVKPFDLFRVYCEVMGMQWRDVPRRRKGKELKYAKELVDAGYGVQDVRGCLTWLKSDSYWQGKPLGLAQVADRVIDWVAAGRPSRVRERVSKSKSSGTGGSGTPDWVYNLGDLIDEWRAGRIKCEADIEKVRAERRARLEREGWGV